MKLSFKKSWTVILTLLALTFSAVGVTPAHAATITVTAGATDLIANNSSCSLREAIINANNDNQSGSTDCLAGSGDDTITVPPGTYTLTIPGINEEAAATGDLDITSNITINGAGAGSTIIQAGTLGVGGPPNGIDRVFRVDGSLTTVSVNISGVTVRNGKTSSGNHGGGVANYLGTLTISKSTFSGNSAGGYGGGISNNGTLIVTSSTFAGNSSMDGGGGILNMGTLTVTSSTFAGNTATRIGVGYGGGMYNNSGTATMTNSLFTGNSATSGGGGIFVGAGTVAIANSTLSVNSAYFFGGGIYDVGTLIM
ncbi:MAG: hypothetical protein IMZ73_03930, partial [Chloroflexi bacterium]|nr:hypothetical protein [Chloroflexota bacterium]